MNKVLEFYSEPYLTGSRAICPDACAENADWDYVVLDDNPPISRLALAGWEGGFGSARNRNNSWSLRNGSINLIIVSTSEEYNKWVEATEEATRLHLTNRADRVALFKRKLDKK